MLNLIEPIPWVDAAIPWVLSAILCFYVGGVIGWALGMRATLKTKIPPGYRITPKGYAYFIYCCVFWPVLVLMTPRGVADGEDRTG